MKKIKYIYIRENATITAASSINDKGDVFRLYFFFSSIFRLVDNFFYSPLHMRSNVRAATKRKKKIIISNAEPEYIKFWRHNTFSLSLSHFTKRIKFCLFIRSEVHDVVKKTLTLTLTQNDSSEVAKIRWEMDAHWDGSMKKAKKNCW